MTRFIGEILGYVVLYIVVVLTVLGLLVLFNGCATPSDPVAERRAEWPNADLITGGVYKQEERR